MLIGQIMRDKRCLGGVEFLNEWDSTLFYFCVDIPIMGGFTVLMERKEIEKIA